MLIVQQFFQNIDVIPRQATNMVENYIPIYNVFGPLLWDPFSSVDLQNTAMLWPALQQHWHVIHLYLLLIY